MIARQILSRLSLVLAALVLPVAAADKAPVGSVAIDQTQFALILGGSTGGGVLTFAGRQYPFTTGGLSLGASLGISRVSVTGEVYDMTELSQFPGTYRKFTAGVALGGGGAALHLKNENGVVLKLSGTTKGLSLDLSASGMSIKMK